MPLLLNAQSITKSYGAAPLFQSISLTVSDGDCIGLIGPNGSGKSTLLEIFAGRTESDSGEVTLRRGTRLGCVPQDSTFAAGDTVRSVIRRVLERGGVQEAERERREAETLGRAGFDNFDSEATALSGGWRKRLAIAEALVQNPAILLLDEPTNHLDFAGIEWLEKLLQNGGFASVVISHDRYFLENVATCITELNRVYPDGSFFVRGNYSAFLEKKGEYLHAQAKRQESLENRVRTEMEWLRRGPKARATKAKARIDAAHQMIGELADLRARARTGATGIDFAATDRKTKRLVHLQGVSHGFNGASLFEDLDFTITAGMRAGLVGANGSGKTTLLRLLRGDIQPQQGR
ncbi:MAG: ABC-F family ATP-binding cassette domain-containing protein, partial [Bryobacteraceae bacterium]